MEVRIEQNLNLIQDLEVKIEFAKIRVPKVSEGDALVHGRISNKSKRGISGLRVIFEDKKGKQLRLLTSETDASGYYAIRIDKDKLKGLKGNVFLTVTTKTGDIVHRQLDPLELKTDEPLVVNVTLDSAIMRSIRKGPKHQSD